MSGDPMDGKRHCDQCFLWFSKTDEHHSSIHWNFPLASGPPVTLEEIFCSKNCLDLWKRGVPPSVSNQTAVK